MSQGEASRMLRQEEIFGDEGPIDSSGMELFEEIITLNRVAKVVKGGRRFRFSALVVVGDRKSVVGMGFGKANEVPEAIGKGVENAKRHLIRVPRLGHTIPHPIIGIYGSARVLLKPAAPGTGLIAGQAVRTVFDLGGIQDIMTKNLGADNVMNVLKATFNGVESMLKADRVAWLRGKTVEEMVGKKRAQIFTEQRQAMGLRMPENAAAYSQPVSFGGDDDEMLGDSGEEEM